jgi:hypothetical protein
MTRAEASVMIDRPAEAVWSFMTSDRFSKSMNPDVVGWKQTSTGPYGVGATFQEMRSKTPKVMDFRVTEYEPNLRMTLVVTSGPIKGTIITEKIEIIEGKTKLTEITDYHFSGFYKLLQPFMDRPGNSQKEGETRVGRVKHAVESEVRP